MLLNSGADPNVKNKEDQTPLDVALDPGVKNCLQLRRLPRNSKSVNYDPEDYEDSD